MEADYSERKYATVTLIEYITAILLSVCKTLSKPEELVIFAILWKAGRPIV